MKGSFKPLALAILAVAVIVLILVVVYPTGRDYQLGVFGIVLGFVAIAIGLFGWDIAQESDEKMQAIANLEFDGKAAMLERYEADFKVSFKKAEFEGFCWDMKALAHVAKWAKPEKRTRVGRTLSVVADGLASNNQVTKDSVEELRRLSQDITGRAN